MIDSDERVILKKIHATVSHSRNSFTTLKIKIPCSSTQNSILVDESEDPVTGVLYQTWMLHQKMSHKCPKCGSYAMDAYRTISLCGSDHLEYQLDEVTLLCCNCSHHMNGTLAR